jgi:hypothetical protein
LSSLADASAKYPDRLDWNQSYEGIVKTHSALKQIFAGHLAQAISKVHIPIIVADTTDCSSESLWIRDKIADSKENNRGLD